MAAVTSLPTSTRFRHQCNSKVTASVVTVNSGTTLSLIIITTITLIIISPVPDSQWTPCKRQNCLQKVEHHKLKVTWLQIRMNINKKAQLSLTNPHDAKACQKLLQFHVLTSSSLTILAYLHLFSCCCVRNLRNPAKFTENSNLWSSRSSKVIDLGVNWKPMYDFLLVTNSNFGRICYRFRDIDA